MDKIKLCTLEELEATGGKSLQLEINNRSVDLFVVRHNGKIFGYVDSCPHTGVMLAWKEDDYFDEDRKFLMCASHGALFSIDSGLCVSGPCNGQSLTSIPVTVENNEIFLEPS